MTLGNVDALEVHPAEARVVDIELLLEGVALLAEDRVGLVDEHARVEDERDDRDGHVGCRVVGGMDHERRMQEEPGDGHGDDHVHGKRADAVLCIGAALDEERRDGAGCQKHQAAVHGAVGDAVVGVGEVPQVVADDPEPQLIGPDVVLLLSAADDDAEEAADADGVQDTGDAVHDVPRAADHHVAVDDAVDARELEVADARLKDVDSEDDGRYADDVLLLEGGEVDDQPAQDRSS